MLVVIGTARYFRVEYGFQIPASVPDSALVVAWNSNDQAHVWDWEVQVDDKGKPLRATKKNREACKLNEMRAGDWVTVKEV